MLVYLCRMNENLRISLLILLLWVAGLGAAMQFAKIAVPFAEVRLLYPDAGNGIGWMLSIISLVGAILGVFTGVLIGWLGAVRILLGGLLLGALISGWQATIPSFPAMLMSRMLEGISHLAIVVAAPTLIAQISPERFRGLTMTLWSTFFGIAFALFAWLGMPIVQAWGMSNIFLLHAITMFLIAGLCAVMLSGHRHNDISVERLHFRSIVAKIVEAYRSPPILAPGIGWLFYTVTFVALLVIIPEILSSELRAWVSGIMPVASIAFSIVAVPILLRMTTATNAVIFGFASAIIVLIFPAGASLANISIALFCVLGIVQGASFAAVPELNPSSDAQALSYGLMAQMGNLGNLVGTPLLLFVLDQTGNSGLFATVAGVYGIAIVAYLLLSSRIPNRQQ